MDNPPPPESAETAAPPREETADPVSAAVAPAPPLGTGPMPCPSDEVLIQRIEAEFAGWGVWRSDARRWWAFRTAANPLTIDQIRAGCRLIVQADTDLELCVAIRAEIDLAQG